MSKEEQRSPTRPKSVSFSSLELTHSPLTPNSSALKRGLNNLEQTIDKAQKLIDAIEKESFAAKYMITFKKLKESAWVAANEAREGLDKSASGLQQSKSTIVLRKQIESQQKEMKSLLDEVLKLQHQQSTYGHKLLEYENRVDGHDGILKMSGAMARAEVQQGFDSLREKNIELYAYCKTFYWTAINLFGAYRALSTNLFVGDIHKNDSIKESVLVVGAKQLASYGAEIAKGLPMVGGVIGALNCLVENLYNIVKQNKFDNKVSSINKVIQSKFGVEEDISTGIAKLAIAMTKTKKQDILNPKNSKDQEVHGLQNAVNYIKKKVEDIKHAILPSIELHDKNSTGATLALVDVTMMFVYILKNCEMIVNDNKPIEEQLAIVMQDGIGILDQLMIEIVDLDTALPLTKIELEVGSSYKDGNGFNENSPTPTTSPENTGEVIPHVEAQQSTELTGQENHSCCVIV